jgi:hypothetical protein
LVSKSQKTNDEENQALVAYAKKRKKEETPVRKKIEYEFQITRRMYLSSDVSTVRSWDTFLINVLKGKERENIFHMQHIWRSPHLRRRQRNQNMKSMSLSELSHILLLKEVIFG